MGGSDVWEITGSLDKSIRRHLDSLNPGVPSMGNVGSGYTKPEIMPALAGLVPSEDHQTRGRKRFFGLESGQR